MTLYTIVTLVQPDGQLLRLISSFLCFHPYLGVTVLRSNILEMFLIHQHIQGYGPEHWLEDPVQDLLDVIILWPERNTSMKRADCLDGFAGISTVLVWPLETVTTRENWLIHSKTERKCILSWLFETWWLITMWPNRQRGNTQTETRWTTLPTTLKWPPGPLACCRFITSPSNTSKW